MTKNPGKLIVTTLGELIEGMDRRLIHRSELPLIFTTINAVCVQAIEDDLLLSGRRKYSAHARDLYPSPDRHFANMDDGQLFHWWDAFWNWREMLTAHDFETLNSERVVMSEVLP